MSILRVFFALSVVVGVYGVRPVHALEGTTVDYAWDGGAHRNKGWYGRAYVPAGVKADQPVPVVVFLHGLNKLLVKHRWMGGGPEDDLRQRLDRWIAAGTLPPLILVGPSSIVKSEVYRGASWRGFDLDHFMRFTRRALHGYGTMDPQRVVLAGHSGAGCSLNGGLATADAAQSDLHAIVVIDTCMNGPFGERMAQVSPETHVVVGYQKLGWTREFKPFEHMFRKTVAERGPATGVLRELDVQTPERDFHNATVLISFERWIPKLLELPSTPHSEANTK